MWEIRNCTTKERCWKKIGFELKRDLTFTSIATRIRWPWCALKTLILWWSTMNGISLLSCCSGYLTTPNGWSTSEHADYFRNPGTVHEYSLIYTTELGWTTPPRWSRTYYSGVRLFPVCVRGCFPVVSTWLNAGFASRSQLTSGELASCSFQFFPVLSCSPFSFLLR